MRAAPLSGSQRALSCLWKLATFTPEAAGHICGWSGFEIIFLICYFIISLLLFYLFIKYL